MQINKIQILIGFRLVLPAFLIIHINHGVVGGIMSFCLIIRIPRGSASAIVGFKSFFII